MLSKPRTTALVTDKHQVYNRRVMASPRSIHEVEANSSTLSLTQEASTGEARGTSVCSPDTESAAALQHYGN